MGFLKPAPERTEVFILQSTHGNTFVTWPTEVVAANETLPSLPIGQQHPKSRQWVMADRTVILILPGDPQTYPGGVIRHTYNVVSSTWNSRTKTLTTNVEHPTDSNFYFTISTSGVGCSCTQGPAGNAGPIAEPYKITMVNQNDPEYDWFQNIVP